MTRFSRVQPRSLPLHPPAWPGPRAEARRKPSRSVSLIQVRWSRTGLGGRLREAGPCTTTSIRGPIALPAAEREPRLLHYSSRDRPLADGRTAIAALRPIRCHGPNQPPGTASPRPVATSSAGAAIQATSLAQGTRPLQRGGIEPLFQSSPAPKARRRTARSHTTECGRVGNHREAAGPPSPAGNASALAGRLGLG